MYNTNLRITFIGQKSEIMQPIFTSSNYSLRLSGFAHSVLSKSHLYF